MGSVDDGLHPDYWIRNCETISLEDDLSFEVLKTNERVEPGQTQFVRGRIIVTLPSGSEHTKTDPLVDSHSDVKQWVVHYKFGRENRSAIFRAFHTQVGWVHNARFPIELLAFQVAVVVEGE